MASMKGIKQRIANINSTEQIIKAMDMVASTKLQKARAQLEGVRPIYHQLKRVVGELGCEEEAKDHIFFTKQPVENTLHIVLTSNRGLCGSYNSNVIAKAMSNMENGEHDQILVIGSRGSDYFKRKGKNIIREIIDVTDTQVYYYTESLSQWVAELYTSGKVDEVYIAYTHFETVLSHIPVIEKIFPIEAPGDVSKPSECSEKKYEPDIESFIEHSIPLYLHMYLFKAFSESHTSEQAARMVNMDAAGKNASDMIEDLTRLYNRKRQAEITQELAEIVGSVNILNKGDLND